MNFERVVSLSEYHRLPQEEQTAEFYKRLLEVVCNNATVALFIMDEYQQCVYMNPAAEQLTGYSLTETRGRPLHDVIHHTRPDGRPYPLCECPIDQAYPKNNQEQGEEIFVHKDGHFYPVAYTASPIREGDRVLGTIIEVRNITQEKLAAQAQRDALTERQRTEVALQESAERLQMALTAANMGDWHWDEATDMVTFSERGAAIFGIAPGPVLTWTEIQGLLHPADRDRTRHAVEQAIIEQSDYNIEYRVLYPDETQCWVLATGRAYYTPEGNVLGMRGMVQDITDRKQVEDALREANIQLESALQAGAVYTWRWNIPENRLTVNATLAQLFGVDPATATTLGLPLETFMEAIHPDDRTRVSKLIQQSIITGADYAAEYRVCTIGGDIRWVMARGSVEYDATGVAIAFPGALADITDRKQSEDALQHALQKLNSHVENTPMAVIEWDEEFWVTRWSGAATQIFGWQAEEVLGRNLSDLNLVLEDEAVEVNQVIQRLMMGEESYIFSGNRNYTKQRQVIHCEWHNSSLRDETGKMRSVLSLVLDVTAQKQAEAERRQLLLQEQTAREAAESANRVKDEFLAVLSHELRSPLNPILGWSRLLQTRKLDPDKTKQALATIERNAKLQSELIEDLLDVSRILRGKLSLNIGPVNLITLIQSAIETMRLAAESKSIHLQTSLELPPGQVMGDASRLQQVLWNLLSNAIKFTPPSGQVGVQLSTQQTAATPYAQITIWDTGKGISPDFLPHVFEYFRQENATTTRQHGGLGLGLAIVHHLVELHGGTIRAESNGADQGATFTVQLPLTAQSLQPPPTPPTQSDCSLNGLKILVVDDDRDTREFLVFLLEQAGATVQSVPSAPAALTRFLSDRPQILLSDIGMPDMDGYQLLRQVRALPAEQGGGTPAIALTAYAGEIDYQQAIAVGFQQHIPKPVEPDRLMQAIINLVQPDLSALNL